MITHTAQKTTVSKPKIFFIYHKVRKFWSVFNKGNTVCLFKLYNIKRSLGRGFNIYFTLYFWLLCSTTRDIFSLYCTRQKKTYQTNKQKTEKSKNKIRLHILYINDILFFVTTNVPKNKRLSISYVFPQFFFYRKSQSKETEVWCESCRFGDLNTKATHFCKTCEDLEPLCENCAQQHVRHKLCRGHEICNGIEEFLDMKEALDKKYVFFNFIFLYVFLKGPCS